MDFKFEATCYFENNWSRSVQVLKEDERTAV